MRVTVMCLSCGQVMRVAPIVLGRSVRCLACDDLFHVSDRPWYYQIQGAVKGPVAPEILTLLAGKNVVRPDTLVRRGDEGRWVPAGAIQGLFELPPS